MVFTARSSKLQELVDNLPQLLSEPKDTGQLFAWVAKLDKDLKSLGPWAGHGDEVQKSTRPLSYKKLHTIRKLFCLMITRHPADFGSRCSHHRWSGGPPWPDKPRPFGA